MPRPDSASHPPTQKVPSCAVIPAIPAMQLMTVASFRFRHFACSAAALLSANKLEIALSALKLLTTEKPLSASFSAATSLPFFSEMLVSAFSMRFPVR